MSLSFSFCRGLPRYACEFYYTTKFPDGTPLFLCFSPEEAILVLSILRKEDAFMIRRKEQMRTSEKPNLRGGEGVIHAYDLLEAPEMREKLKLCSILTIEPGCSIGEHPHGPDAEFYYLLEGELEVTDNGEKTTFHPGDAMFTACGETHSARNNTQKDAKLLAIVIA